MKRDDNCRERIEKWLAAPGVAGEEMIWVGKGYSLAQLKRDVYMELEWLEESAELNAYPRTDW